MATTTVLHAVQSQNVDISLAFCRMVGGAAGAKFGASAGKYLHGELLRGLLALLVLAVAVGFGLSLVLTPTNPFTMAVVGGSQRDFLPFACYLPALCWSQPTARG